jgi:maltooligosyltrehalose trehalohydrolase
VKTLGATVLPDGRTRFRVWAPRPRAVALELAGRDPIELDRAGDLYEATVVGVGPGADYVYVLDGERRRPDPASRWQPAGVHGPSRVVDPGAFPWTDAAWRGLPLEAYVVYEVHVGTFTAEGTFDAAIARLDAVRDLGVTAVELMPVAEFPGGRNWGYDGVHLFAPQSTYGGPEALRRLVDACHARGLAVVLDVVYNHLGPEGNYLGEMAPFFTSRYETPWGDAINLDGPGSDGVRRHLIENACYWLEELHVDALRLDAIHGIFDFSARHVLEELATAFHARAAARGRAAHVIAESDLNDPRVVHPPARGGHGLDAQWSDDFHHAVRTALTGDRRGYFADFGRAADVGKAVTEGYVVAGAYSRFRDRRHGSSSADVPGRQLVVCVHNHDQIANGSGGDRLAQVVGLERAKLAAALCLTAPSVPLLFMGEDWADPAPFLYFISHGDPALVEAVRAGRRAELAAWAGRHVDDDPAAEATFARCRLDWSLRERPPHAQVLALYRDLLALRAGHACLGNCRKDLTRARTSEAPPWIVVERGDPSGAAAVIVANLGDAPLDAPPPPGARLALATCDPRYGGPGLAPDGACPPGAALVYLREQPT